MSKNIKKLFILFFLISNIYSLQAMEKITGKKRKRKENPKAQSQVESLPQYQKKSQLDLEMEVYPQKELPLRQSCQLQYPELEEIYPILGQDIISNLKNKIIGVIATKFVELIDTIKTPTAKIKFLFLCNKITDIITTQNPDQPNQVEQIQSMFQDKRVLPKCSICKNAFTIKNIINTCQNTQQYNKRIVTTHCYHSLFHETCLTDFITKQQEKNHHTTCPFCHTLIEHKDIFLISPLMINQENLTGPEKILFTQIEELLNIME